MSGGMGEIYEISGVKSGVGTRRSKAQPKTHLELWEAVVRYVERESGGVSSPGELRTKGGGSGGQQAEK